MEDAIKDWVYAFFDSSQAVALVAIGFITLFYTTKSSENTGLKLLLRRIAKVSVPIYLLLLLAYLSYKAVDARCEERMVKIQGLKASINAMLARDSSRITSIRSKIALNLNTIDSLESVNKLRQEITDINYNRIQRLQNFRVYVSEYCTGCNDYSITKHKFDSLKTVMAHEN